MANWTTTALTNLFNLVFNGTSWTNIAQNITASPATVFYLSLHNADPGPTGTQSTSETAYTGYVRLSVVRTASGFTVGGSSPQVNSSNTGSVSFAQCTGGSDTLTHIGVGLASSGTGTLLYSLPIGPGPTYNYTCTLASPGVLTIPGSSLSVNARLSVYADFNNQLPSGLTEGVVYYIGTAPGGALYTLSTTPSNANPVNTSTAGGGFLVVQATLAVSNGVTPTFPAGSVIFYQA